MIIKSFLFCSLFVLFSCNNNVKSNPQINKLNTTVEQTFNNNIEFAQIINIPLPDGYSRIVNDENSFANWLGKIALKKDITVYTFDRSKKYNQNAQYAVLDISIGKRDLQQCADAVMRLRAEYLFLQNKMHEIIFVDNDGISYKFKEPYTYSHFTQYLNTVFGMCGSASLAKQLKSKNNFKNIQAGDVIIRGGFPGHAVIVIDVAENEAGKKIYMIAQSYMPAQDIHILKNPTNENLSPWYEVNDEFLINTPEYTFKRTELMEW